MKRYIIGIDLGGTNIKSAVYSAAFEALVERNDPTEAAAGPIFVLDKIKRIVVDMLAELNAAQEEVKCMGMGIPGLLNPAEGLSYFSPNFPEWENIHIVQEMQNVFSFPVFIDNDVRTNLYGEWRFGAGAGVKNLMLLTLGTGLGSGIVMNGAVLYGETASAGEIGHMNMYREGRPCRCGSSGCLGRYVSAVGMVRTFTERLAEGRSSIVQERIDGKIENLTAQMISDAYDAGDGLAIEVMHETGQILGFGLAMAINLFNPGLVVIGGGMSAAGERLFASAREIVTKHSLRVSSQACTIVTAQLGGNAGRVGAAFYGSGRLSGEISV